MQHETAQGVQVRSRKDERPNTSKPTKNWKEVSFILDDVEKTGLIAKDWLYYDVDGQWYKLNIKKAGLDVSQLVLGSVVKTKQSIEDKRARRQVRRKARRAAKKLEAVEQ